MKRVSLLFLLFAALAITARPTVGAGTGTLAGTVLDAHGTPVADATVTLQTSDGRHPIATATNGQGRYFFPQLRRGYYDVRAYHHGAWSEWKHNVMVTVGRQTEITLRLRHNKNGQR